MEKLTIKFPYVQEFLPTKRHKKPRRKELFDNINISIKEISKDNFPIAFIVHDSVSLYDGAKDYGDFSDDKYVGYKVCPREIRTFNGKLYQAVVIVHGAAISTLYEEPTSYITRCLEGFTRTLTPIYSFSEEITEKSVLLSNDKDERKKKIKKYSKEFIVCDGKVYCERSEPMYLIQTFGLGHNHGGTGFFIEGYYNSNIPARNYFNALQYKEAVEYGKKVATRRGDTESVERIGKFGNEDIYIEVLMPEMVKRNPNKEHGKGDAFSNDLEKIIEGTNSSFEAGLLCIMKTAQAMSN